MFPCVLSKPDAQHCSDSLAILEAIPLPMLASPMNSAYQNGERFDQVSFVSEEQWRGSSRRDILYGLRGYLYSHGVPHISPFYGGMALVSLFAIVFVATHCSTRILHMDTPWWHQRRRLADEHQEVASNGGKRGDSPPCEWLNNVGKGQVNQKSIGIPTPMVALSGSNTRPAGHGVKVMWETANDEELQRIATLQKESGIPLDSESTLLGERLSESLELLIESALTDVSSLRVEPWLLDPGLEVPEGLLLEGEEEGEGPLPQDFSEAGTSKTWDGMGFGSTVSVSPPAAFGEPSTATMQQLSQQAACAVVTDVQQSSSISSSHGPRIAGNRNAHAHSFLGTAQEAEQGLTSGGVIHYRRQLHRQIWFSAFSLAHNLYNGGTVGVAMLHQQNKTLRILFALMQTPYKAQPVMFLNRGTLAYR